MHRARRWFIYPILYFKYSFSTPVREMLFENYKGYVDKFSYAPRGKSGHQLEGSISGGMCIYLNGME